MRIALVKPDWHVTGGFERVLSRVVACLEDDGHTVITRAVDVPSLPRTTFGIEIPASLWEDNVEYFRYMRMVEAFRQLDVSGFDLVLTTQPPSFCVEHPRQLAILYHQHKVYYDLSDAYVAAGLVEARPHRQAQHQVRRVDAQGLAAVTRFLLPSTAVRHRLRDYNQITDNLDPFLAGPTVAPPTDNGVSTGLGDHVLCVSRHEFSKRAELFVHAMKYLPDLTGVVTGTGGRLPFLTELDRRISKPGIDLAALGAHDLWLNPGRATGDPAGSARAGNTTSNVRFLGHVTEDDLLVLYRTAMCIVAPAFSEDYGLTAIEAMAHGRPVIVCSDGGGLTELVVDGVTGLIVEPTGTAIANAVSRLANDPDLARTMGAAAQACALEYTWERAFTQLRASVDRVMS